MEAEIQNITTGVESYFQKMFQYLSFNEDTGFAVTDFGSFLQVSLVLSLLVVLSVQYFQRKSNKERNQNAADGKPGPTNQITLAHNYFPTFGFPLFQLIDGCGSLHKLRKYGVKYLDWLKENWGNLFRIRLGVSSVILVADANVMQKILTSNDPHHLNKPRPVYDFLFVEFLRDGLVASETEIWSPHRKIMARSFTYKALCTYNKLMNTHAKNLAHDLLRSCLPDKKDDGYKNSESECTTGKKMYDLIYFHAIKIISEICMGSNFCTNEEASQFHHAVARWKQIVLHRFLNPILLISPVWWLHPIKKEFDARYKDITDFMVKVINSYRMNRESKSTAEYIESEVNTEVKCTISTEDAGLEDVEGVKPFRCLIEEMISSNATDKEIFDEFGTVMLAGHESVAMALQMLMFNLASNPDQQSECIKEVDSIFDEKREKKIFNEDLTMDDLANLKYLERCVLESGRLTPTFPMYLRRLDAPLQVDDKLEIEKGANLVFLPWCLHRDPEHFPDPKRFDPDRFLPENVLKRHPYAYIPFSGGPRNCIGWKVAIMEIKIIMAWMLRHFEIYTSDGPDDVKLLFEITLLPERQYNITLKKRQIATTT